MPKIAFKNVTKCFGDQKVLRHISFELPPGAKCALLGPNGSGKSTLIKLVGGLLKPDDGQVIIGGLEPWQKSVAVKKNLGLLLEGSPLMGELTVTEHLNLAARLRQLPVSVFKQEEERLTDGLNLGDFKDRPTALLSQGQKRRAALAAALIGNPDFLVLDEPTSGLDPEEAERLTCFIKNLPTTTTLLISTHILTEARHLTDQILVIAQGILVAFGAWDLIENVDLAGHEAALRQGYRQLLREKNHHGPN